MKLRKILFVALCVPALAFANNEGRGDDRRGNEHGQQQQGHTGGQHHGQKPGGYDGEHPRPPAHTPPNHQPPHAPIHHTNANTAYGGEGGKGGAGGNVGPIDVKANPTATAYGGVSKSVAEGGDAKATGGNATANGGIGKGGDGGSSTASATGNGAGNNTSTNVGGTTSNYSYVDKRVNVPVLFNPLPPMVTVAGQMVSERLACGPLQQVMKTQVNGKHIGIISDTAVDLGTDGELVSVFDTNGNRVYYREQKFVEDGVEVTRRFGTQAVITTGQPIVSGASSFSIGLAGVNGGVSGGAGSQSAMSRIISKIIISDCELPGAYKIVRETTAPSLTKNDIIAAMNAATMSITVPTEKVVQGRVQCKMETFTDSTGKKVEMCRGPAGSYGTTKVVPGSVTAQGRLSVSAEACKSSPGICPK